MRLIVEPIFTHAEGDFIEMQMLESLLTTKSGDDEERTLLQENKFYTGLLPRVESLLASQSCDYDLEWTYDNRFKNPSEIVFPDTILPGIELRPHQISAGMKLIARGGRGLVCMGTSGGKTEVAVAITKYYDVPALFVNDRVRHTSQSYERYLKYGLDCGKAIGSDRDLDHQIVSINSDGFYSGLKNYDRDLIDLIKRTELVIFDECHHLASNLWMHLGNNLGAGMRIGLSASPFDDPEDRCYEDMLVIGQTGDIVCYVTPRWLIDRGYTAEPLIHFTPINTAKPSGYDWQKVYTEGVVRNQYRNTIIAGYARILRDRGFKVLILVQRIEHGKTLLSMIQDPSAVFSFGGEQMFRWDNGECVDVNMTAEELGIMFDCQTSGIMIGSTVFDEAVSLPSITSLILAGGYKKYRRTLQRIGRASHSKNDFVHVFDFWDYQHPFLQKHSRERLGVYNYLEYKAYNGLTEFQNLTGIQMDYQSVVMNNVRGRSNLEGVA